MQMFRQLFKVDALTVKEDTSSGNLSSQRNEC